MLFKLSIFITLTCTIACILLKVRNIHYIHILLNYIRSNSHLDQYRIALKDFIVLNIVISSGERLVTITVNIHLFFELSNHIERFATELFASRHSICKKKTTNIYVSTSDRIFSSSVNGHAIFIFVH